MDDQSNPTSLTNDHDTPAEQPSPTATEPVPPSLPPDPRGYVAEAFGAFFGDPTWLKRALVGGLVNSVPFVGAIAAEGYALGWMRQTAWSVDRGLPAADDIGGILTVGLRAFVVRLMWLLMSIVAVLLIGAPAIALAILAGESGPEFGIAIGAFAALLGIAAFAVFVALLFVAESGVIRCTMYERITAGTSLDGPLGLIKRHKWGFAKAIGVTTLATLPGLAVSGMNQAATALLGESQLALLLPIVAVVAWYMGALFGFIAIMISGRAYGRWMREIGPASLPPLDA